MLSSYFRIFFIFLGLTHNDNKSSTTINRMILELLNLWLKSKYLSNTVFYLAHPGF